MYMNVGARGSQQRAPDPTELDFPGQVESLHVEHCALSPMQSMTCCRESTFGVLRPSQAPSKREHGMDHTAGENR